MGACGSKHKVKDKPDAKPEQLNVQANAVGKTGQEAESSQPGAVNTVKIDQEPGQSQPMPEENKHEWYEVGPSQPKMVGSKPGANLSQSRREETKFSQPRAVTTNQEPGQPQPRPRDIKHEAGPSQPKMVGKQPGASSSQSRRGEFSFSQPRASTINQEPGQSQPRPRDIKHEAGPSQPKTVVTVRNSPGASSSQSRREETRFSQPRAVPTNLEPGQSLPRPRETKHQAGPLLSKNKQEPSPSWSRRGETGETRFSQPGAVNTINTDQEPEQSQPRPRAIKHEAGPSRPENVGNKQEASSSSSKCGENHTMEQAEPSQREDKEIKQETQPEDEENKQEVGSSKAEDASEDTTDLIPLPMEGRISDAKFTDRYSGDNDLGYLGKGRYSTVQLGIEKKTGKQYAIKTMRLSGGPRGNDSAWNRREEVSNEISILMSLQHPNILTMKEYFEEDNQVYLVTELLSGGELLPAVVEYPGYSEAHARICFAQILDGLSYLHTQGITHMDINSDNILLAGLQDTNHIKIIDFGAAKTANSPMTTHIGSPFYTAPEMLRRDATYTSAVDLWSAGVVLFFLLGGKPPFNYTQPAQIYAAIKEAKFSFEAFPWKKISESGKDLVSKLLVLDPKSRLTAAEAQNHPWFTDASIRQDRALRFTRGALKNFHKQKLDC